MTVNKTIYVDMDDVICETCRGFLALLENDFGRQVAFEKVLDFDLTRSFDMSQDELEEFMERAHRPEFLSSLGPMPGALETIRIWVESGYRVDVRTGRPPSTRACTEDWLRRHGVDFGSLEFVDKYGRIDADPSFAEAMTLADLAEERFCLAVEDSASTAMYLAANGVAPVFLIDRPWNRKGVNGDIRRMAGWQEVARVWPVPAMGPQADPA